MRQSQINHLKSSDVPFREFIVEWRLDALPLLSQSLLKTTQIISREFSVAPLKFAGDPPHQISLTEENISAWLLDFKLFLHAQISKAFCLSDDPKTPNLILWLGPSNRIQDAKISFANPERFPLNSILTVMGETCTAFRAFYGYTSDTVLKKVHGRRLRSHEIGISKLSLNERHRVPAPSMVGISDDLPKLLIRSEFDYSCAPDGIWWINFWTSKQVETVGIDRIHSAGWFRVVEQPKGGLILVATEEPTDVRRPEHRKKLGAIVEHLRLRELQEAYRVKI